MNLQKGLKTQILLIIWTLIAGFVQLGLLWLNHFSFEIAWKDALLSVAIISFITQVIYLIQTHYHSLKPVNFSNFALVLMLTGFYQVAVNTTLRWWLGKEIWQASIFPYEGARAFIVFFLLMVISLYWWIQKNQSTQEKIQQQMLEQERALTKAELDNIHQQLQPHFLFNSLNSIGALTILEPTEAHRMIQLLSTFLRGTLRKDIQQLVPIEDEIEQLKLYLEIEKIRFGHRLKTEISYTDACNEAKLPALLLQPIIENAIKYGLYGQTDNITIHIDLKCDGNILLISVKSPFDADFVSESKGSGFGLSSIRRRLALFYGQQDLLKTHQSDTHFTATLRIPQV